jgi:hypothetical protein
MVHYGVPVLLKTGVLYQGFFNKTDVILQGEVNYRQIHRLKTNGTTTN